MKKLIAIVLFLIGSSEVYALDPIVYSRCVRTAQPLSLTADVTINGEQKKITRTMRGVDIYDVLPDVSNFFGGFTAPCDLVFRQPDGSEEVIYNCSATSTDESACAALDANVSFDAKKIAFSVFRGSLYSYDTSIHNQVIAPNADPGWLTGRFKLPSKRLKTIGSHIHIYDLETKQTRSMPFVEGIWDSGPVFMPKNRIAFTSNRDGNTSTMVWRSNNSKMGSRIWTMDSDFKNIDLASHHSLSLEQGPFMLKDGRLAYSSWQIFGGLPFRHTNGSTGGFTTLGNLFHIYTQSPDGAGNFPLYGQHSGDHIPSSFGASHNASHFITQTSNERVWFADYYRANNKGLGKIIGIIPEPKGQEGINPHEAKTYSDMYVPRDAIDFARWATNGDTVSENMREPDLIHPNYKDPLPWAGKVGHPAALPDNGLMLSWGKGACSTVGHFNVFYKLGFEKPFPPLTSGSGGGVPMNIVTTTGLDTPGCDVGVYRATKIPSEHPSDLEMIVDSPDWHEIMARAVVPYSAIHGVNEPKKIERADKLITHPALPRGTPFGLLGAASITDRETHPRGGIKFVGEHQFNLQGTDTINYDDEDLCGIRMIGVMPNRGTNTYREIANIAGERLAILGEIPVKHTDSQGNRIIDPSGHLDTSFLLSMPANMPYIMQGIDCEGRTLNTDQTWQALRPGEMKTCGGCHVHSKPTRISFDQSFAARPEYQIPELGRGTVPLIDGSNVPGNGWQLEFTKDIKPILDKRCVSCHGGDNPVAGLSLDKTGTKNNVKGTTWWRLVADYTNEYSGGGKWLRRPQLTKYIRAFNALGSLLYWKAANERTDSFTDDSRENDIDFGSDHPTDITDEELGVLSRWIDLGNPGGDKELLDTQKPTVHLAANVENEDIKSLLVGVADLGTGIYESSLKVAVNGNPISTQDLMTNSVNIVTLPKSISSGDIKVSVSDLEGNTTTVERTVEKLLNTSTTVEPPVVEPPVVTKFNIPLTEGNINLELNSNSIDDQLVINIPETELDKLKVTGNILVTKIKPKIINELIVDNTNSKYTESQGNWIISSGKNPYGTDSVYANATGEYFTWKFSQIEVPSKYKVYTRWTAWHNRHNAVPYDVHHSNGIDTVVLNQRSNASEWVLLGEFNLDDKSKIVLRHVGGARTTNADAIKLEIVPDSQIPDSVDTNNILGALQEANTIMAEEEFLEIVLPIALSDEVRVTLKGLPNGSIWDEPTRTIRLKPDFTQGGKDYIVEVTARYQGKVYTGDFVIKVLDTITPPDPVITSTEEVWKAKIHSISLTTDDFLDPPNKAGSTYILKVYVPDYMNESNKGGVNITLHGSGGGFGKKGSSGRSTGGISFGPPDETLSQHTGQHSDYPNTANINSKWTPTAQRRILHILDWITRTFPGVDRNNVTIHGASMGATGAVYFAAQYPYHIVSASGGSGGTTPLLYSNYSANTRASFWGSKELDIKDDDGLSAWNRYDMSRAIRDDKRVRDVYFSTYHGTKDNLAKFSLATTPSPLTGLSWYQALQDFGIGHRVTWDGSGHGNADPDIPRFWQGSRDKRAYLRLNKAFPAFSNSSIDWEAPLFNESTNSTEGGDAQGSYNRHLAWDTDNILDTFDEFRIPLFVVVKQAEETQDPNQPFYGEGIPEEKLPVVVDVTLRRVQNFKVLPNEQLNWKLGQQSGTIIVNSDSEIHIKRLSLDNNIENLVITR